MRPPERRLSAAEAELWARLAKTVRPFEQPRRALPAAASPPAGALPLPAPPPPATRPNNRPAAAPLADRHSLDGHTLDANWDRKLTRGLASPDFTLDLHGATLDGAYARLDHGLGLAIAQGARVVLLITGRPQAPLDPADRAGRRGAIRAKFLDWLVQGRHASRIAAVRPAHPRHGGIGAVYIVLRKAREQRG